MRTILIPVDASENALRAVRHAASMAAEDPSLQFHLLNVQEPFQLSLHAYLAQEQIHGIQKAEAQHALQPAVRILDAAGAACHPEWRVGPVPQTIADYASEIGCEAIVMGTRGMSAIANLLIGSTAAKVIHLASVPVTLVK